MSMMSLVSIIFLLALMVSANTMAEAVSTLQLPHRHVVAPWRAKSHNRNKWRHPFSPRRHELVKVVSDLRGGFLGQKKMDKFLDGLFDNADTNKDGSISMDETFELVLYMYIKINRQAPIPAPTRQKVQALFANADRDNNRRLARPEFKRLMMVLVRRASTRVLLHKIVKLLVAPILALYVVHRLTGNEFLYKLADNFPEKVANILHRSDVWKIVLTVAFVATLGNFVLSIANILLDIIDLGKSEQDNKKGNKKM